MLKVDRTVTYGAFAEVIDGHAIPAARAAAELALKAAANNNRTPVQIEVIVRVAPKEQTWT